MSFKLNRKLIVLFAVVFIVAASSAMCVSAASGSMKNEDFKIFTMDVPKDVDLVPLGLDEDDGLVTILYLNNDPDTANDVIWLDVWLGDSFSKIPAVESQFDLINKSGSTSIYKASEDGETFYWVIKDYKHANTSIGVLGGDLKTLKKMVKSIELS